MNNWITAEMLGDMATDEQAARMAALLSEQGYAPGDDIPQEVWDAALDTISAESYGN